jgi:hypothetical protein
MSRDLRDIDACHNPKGHPSFPYAAYYVCRHVPSGKEWTHSVHFLSRVHMLELLDHWNGQQPARWHYRSL